MHIILQHGVINGVYVYVSKKIYACMKCTSLYK